MRCGASVVTFVRLANASVIDSMQIKPIMVSPKLTGKLLIAFQVVSPEPGRPETIRQRHSTSC